MRGYLSVTGMNSGTIPVEERVEIYRDPGDTEEVIAETPDNKHRLGVKDVTVSRKKNDTPPVVVQPRQSSIEIRNKQNTNGVRIVEDDEERELAEGRTVTVSDTTAITIGYQTRLRLTLKREARTEIDIGGDVSGDIVAGDQKNIDASTRVVDSVVNRSNVGGEEEAKVDESVLNRSNVGDEQAGPSGNGSIGSADGPPPGTSRDPSDSENGDTQKHCQIHERMYTGEVCPECAQKQPAEATIDKTKYCMYCGTEIPASASTCPDCGQRFPDR